jgi:hypothetical protein
MWLSVELANGQSKSASDDSPLEKTKAAENPAMLFIEVTDHFLCAVESSPAISKIAADCSGASETEKRSSGKASPWPMALTKASLRVQQLKNPAVRAGSGSRFSSLISGSEK